MISFVGGLLAGNCIFLDMKNHKKNKNVIIVCFRYSILKMSSGSNIKV